jgi:3-methyladenine DNA glycosylase AlkD
MTMTYDETMAALEAAGTEQTRKTYLRHGASEPLFGVKFGDLRPLGRKIGTDHALAEQLWASGNADARLLACMVADPRAVTEDELDAWLEDIDNYFLVDIFVAEIASKTPGRVARAERWIASDRDRTAQAGWDLMNYVALSDEDVADDFFEAQLALIADRIEGYGNWTRRSASNTITGIGLRNDELEAAARKTAAEMGHVEFDPGQTSCVMPDPIEYLEKTKAYRARQAQKRAARVSG